MVLKILCLKMVIGKTVGFAPKHENPSGFLRTRFDVVRGKSAGAWIGVTKVIRGVHFVGDAQSWFRDVIRLLSNLTKGTTLLNKLTSQ